MKKVYTVYTVGPNSTIKDEIGLGNNMHGIRNVYVTGKKDH